MTDSENFTLIDAPREKIALVCLHKNKPAKQDWCDSLLMTVLKTRTVVIFKAYSDFYNIIGPSMTLIELPRSLWTLHDLHGNTMTLIDLSLTSRQSMNLTRHSLILLEPHEPLMTLMDLTWPSWTQHDLHGPNMTLMDPTWPSWKHHDPYRPFLNLQTLHEPNQNFIETSL